jgi:hypothetical protein
VGHELIKSDMLGRAICKHCGLSKEILTTDCPGESLKDDKIHDISLGNIDYFAEHGRVSLKDTRAKILDVLTMLVPVIFGIILVLAYLELQNWLFNSSEYQIFVPMPNSMFGVTSLIMIPMILVGILLSIRNNEFPYKKQIIKYLKRAVIIILPVSLVVLTTAMFDYAGLKDNGVYWGQFLTTKQQYQSWNEVGRVSIGMSHTTKNTNFNFIVTFKDGKALDIWNDNTIELIKIKNELSTRGVPISVGTLDESDLPGVYKDNIQAIRQIFDIK